MVDKVVMRINTPPPPFQKNSRSAYAIPDAGMCMSSASHPGWESAMLPTHSNVHRASRLADITRDAPVTIPKNSSIVSLSNLLHTGRVVRIMFLIDFYLQSIQRPTPTALSLKF